MANKEYRLRENGENESLIAYKPLTQKLLVSRDINTPEAAESFFNPHYENDLHDPFLLDDMEKAVNRILKAIENSEKILVYSDYDADGIPGGVALREFFENIGHKNIENYIPDRHEEGYGVHKEAIEQFGSDGVDLIITVDCGIVDVEPINHAKELGIDVIITDHHEQNGPAPDAYAIINPKRKDSTYPYKELCGSGVVFKLIQAILSKKRFELKDGAEKWFLDLVGIATLSDMVPLTGENRALAHYGLKVIRKSPRPGLQKLFKKSGLSQSVINEEDVTFSITPRLNAASRMGHPRDTFNLLFTRDTVEADTVSDYLNQINDERKVMVAQIMKDIHKTMRDRSEIPPVFVIGNPLWKPALLGLVAGRILDDLKRPIFVWGRNGDQEIKGSCRSDGSANMVLLMEEAKNSFLHFGGHKLAGGFSTTNEKIHTLEEEICAAYEKVREVKKEDVEWVEEKLQLNDIDWNLYNEVEKFAPFGIGNTKPKFLFSKVIPKDVKLFGKEKNHLEIAFENKKGMVIKAISFFSKPDSYENKPEVGKPIDLIATLEKSMYRTYPELRLRIVDII